MDSINNYYFVSAGVLASYFIVVLRAENPIDYPYFRIFHKVLPGVVIYLAVFSALGIGLFEALNVVPDQFGFPPAKLWIPAFLSGVIAPQLTRAKSLPKDYPGAKTIKKFLAFSYLLQQVDELTAINLTKHYYRAERNIAWDILHKESLDYRVEIDHLFERSITEVVNALHRTMAFPPKDPTNITKMRFRGNKAKYLLRTFGYKDTLKKLKLIREGKVAPLGDWCINIPDRRGKHIQDGHELRRGPENSCERRRFDDPEAALKEFRDNLNYCEACQKVLDKNGKKCEVCEKLVV